MSDRWDEKAREIGDALNADGISYGGENVGDVINNIGWRTIAAALRAAYDRGVEDSAGVADSWMADESGPNYGMMPDEARRELRGENRLAFKIAAAIRALNGDGE